jgi:hypothetical protein
MRSLAKPPYRRGGDATPPLFNKLVQGAVDQRGGRNAREPLAMAASNLIDVWTSEFQKFSAMFVRMRRGHYEEDEEEVRGK